MLPFWILFLGDSTMRQLASMAVTDLNGTLGDPSWPGVDHRIKSGCVSPEKTGSHGCLRDWMNDYYRVTFIFQTRTNGIEWLHDQLFTPSNQPDLVVVSPGAWDLYKGRWQRGQISEWLELVRELHPNTHAVAQTICNAASPTATAVKILNREMRETLGDTCYHHRQSVELDQCQGFHLGPVDVNRSWTELRQSLSI